MQFFRRICPSAERFESRPKSETQSRPLESRSRSSERSSRKACWVGRGQFYRYPPARKYGKQHSGRLCARARDSILFEWLEDQMRVSNRLPWVAVAALSCALPVLAHHSFAAEFDGDKTV